MEQTPSENTISSQKSLPPSHDPGWNDPPEWAFDSNRIQSSSAGMSTKRLLNKRVAFPLSTQSSSEKASLPSSSKTPPVLQNFATPIITSAPHKPFITPVVKNLSTFEFDKNQALNESLINLETVMTKQKIEKNKIEEIQRRLDVMKSDWLESKLNNTIQRSILDISKVVLSALLDKDVGEADRIHIALMMQHAAACRAWIPAIRHIIFELKKTCLDSDVSKLEYSQSPLLSVETLDK